MPTIQIRIDEKTKNASKRVFDRLGLDTSAAVKMYLRQVVQRKGIPFLVVTENGLTLEQEEMILKASMEAKEGKNISRPLQGKAIVRYLKTLR